MQEILKVEKRPEDFSAFQTAAKDRAGRKRMESRVGRLSFSAYEGEIFGLLGPNGAGKTTMLRILSTLIKADEGESYVNGANVKSEPDKVRASLGFMTGRTQTGRVFHAQLPVRFFRETVRHERGKDRRQAGGNCSKNSGSINLPRSRWGNCPRA